MKRFSILAPVALLLVLSVLFASGHSSRATAQEETTDHPIVGIWLADTDPEITGNADSIFTFDAAGGYVELHPDGEVLIGRWEATGPTTANLTIASTMADENEAPLGLFLIRVAVEVAADTSSLTASYTFEFVNPDGSSLGQGGPGTVIATRIPVESPGAPVMTLEELFTQIEGGDEATPIP